MLKKTIPYTDFNGTDRVEEAYFNLSEAEVMEMEMGVIGGLSTMIENIIAAENTPEIIRIFKDLIIKSYGVKTPDGKGFMKKPELVEAFTQTEAYSNLFMELATDTEKAIEFVNGIMPKKLHERAGNSAQVTPIAKSSNNEHNKQS